MARGSRGLWLWLAIVVVLAGTLFSFSFFCLFELVLPPFVDLFTGEQCQSFFFKSSVQSWVFLVSLVTFGKESERGSL